ncbi:MAG TPA: VOC family protein [Stellaceae bacterium]|jgi:catechol 2,3-dioxygenase-like lactoylglutathione lyase family enzyme
MATAKLRHIALTVPDLKRETEFYEKVFGFTKHSESENAVSLSDGVMNVTLLKYRPDRYAGKDQGNAVIGIDHIGFVIDDPQEYAAMDERIKANGGVFHAKATAGQALETKYCDPHGVIFDISEPEHTWQGIKY